MSKEFRLLHSTKMQHQLGLFAFLLTILRITGSNILYQCGSGIKGNQNAERVSEIFRALIGGCIKLKSLNKLQQMHDCNTQS